MSAVYGRVLIATKESAIREDVIWAKRRIPEFAALPFENQRLIVRIAQKKVVYTYREQLGLVARFLLPLLVGQALVFFTFHALHSRRHGRNDPIELKVGVGFALCAVSSVVLVTRYRRALLLPRIRAELTGICPVCGYNLRGNASGKCPECGASIPVKSAESHSTLDAPPFTATSGPATASDSLCQSHDLVARYRLKVLTTLTQPVESSASSLRNINEVVVRWARFRGAACESVLFAFRNVPPARQPELVSQVARIFRQNLPESATLQNLQIEVSVEDDAGHELMKVGMVPGT